MKYLCTLPKITVWYLYLQKLGSNFKSLQEIDYVDETMCYFVDHQFINNKMQGRSAPNHVFVYISLTLLNTFSIFFFLNFSLSLSSPFISFLILSPSQVLSLFLFLC